MDWRVLGEGVVEGGRRGVLRKMEGGYRGTERGSGGVMGQFCGFYILYWGRGYLWQATNFRIIFLNK